MGGLLDLSCMLSMYGVEGGTAEDERGGREQTLFLFFLFGAVGDITVSLFFLDQYRSRLPKLLIAARMCLKAANKRKG